MHDALTPTAYAISLAAVAQSDDAHRSGVSQYMSTRYVIASTNLRRMTMWTKPAAADLRFGFEVTMYIAAR
jgi:coenzyme PQQ precursor peptide PqqA